MLSSYTRTSSLALLAIFSAAATVFCEAATSATILSTSNATTSATLPPTSKATPRQNDTGTDPGRPTTIIKTTLPDCNVGSRVWCPHNHSCYVTPDGFKCDNWKTTGWVIIPDLHVFFANPPENQTASTSGVCTVLPIPTNNTLQDLLVLGVKRYDAYYRTSTILISDKPTSILTGYSNCNDVHQRCVDEQCVPVIPLGGVCEGNSECFNAHLNDTTTVGPICEYMTGKLDQPPRCANYIQIPAHPDNDTSPIHGRHRRSYIWIYVVAVLLFALLAVSLCMCWRSRRPQRIVPTAIDQSFEEPVAALDMGPMRGRRMSSAAGLMHEKDIELDQAFLSRIGHRSGTVHRTERLWGGNAMVIQPPVIEPSVETVHEEQVGNGVDIVDVPPSAPTFEPAHELPTVTFAPMEPSKDSPN